MLNQPDEKKIKTKMKNNAFKKINDGVSFVIN